MTTPTPETPAGGLTTAADLIASERRRQIEAEGWTAQHDAGHGPGVLRRAASAYENHPADEPWVPSAWPWDESWWKPKDHLSNLIRAGALYQAAADIGLPEHTGLHRDAIARCARKIDAILAHPAVAAAVVQARAEDRAHIEAAAKSQALREAAAMTIGCEHSNEILSCQACQDWSSALLLMADSFLTATEDGDHP